MRRAWRRGAVTGWWGMSRGKRRLTPSPSPKGEGSKHELPLAESEAFSGWELCLLCYGDGYYVDEDGREHQCADCHGYGQVWAGR